MCAQQRAFPASAIILVYLLIACKATGLTVSTADWVDVHKKLNGNGSVGSELSRGETDT